MPAEPVAASPHDQLVALEDIVLDFEVDVLADRLLYVRVSHVESFIDDLLDALWDAQRNPKVRAA